MTLLKQVMGLAAGYDPPLPGHIGSASDGVCGVHLSSSVSIAYSVYMLHQGWN